MTVTDTGVASLKASASVRADLPAGGTGGWLSPHLHWDHPRPTGWESSDGAEEGLSPASRPFVLTASSFPQQNLWLLSPGVQPPHVPRPPPPSRTPGTEMFRDARAAAWSSPGAAVLGCL